MKIIIDQLGAVSRPTAIDAGVNDVEIRECYTGLTLVTAEGNQYGISMRDDTIEIGVVGDAPGPIVRNDEAPFRLESGTDGVGWPGAPEEEQVTWRS